MKDFWRENLFILKCIQDTTELLEYYLFPLGPMDLLFILENNTLEVQWKITMVFFV